MRSRTCISAEVVDSDTWLKLSPSSVKLYIYLILEADSSGFVRSPKRICSGVGLSEALNELYENGYLIKYEGGCYITHEWVNNSFQARVFQNAMSKCAPYKKGILKFEDEPGKSCYKLVDISSLNSTELELNNIRITNSTSTSTTTATATSTATATATASLNDVQSTSEQRLNDVQSTSEQRLNDVQSTSEQRLNDVQSTNNRRSTDESATICHRCNALAKEKFENNNWYIVCQNCGTYKLED